MADLVCCRRVGRDVKRVHEDAAVLVELGLILFVITFIVLSLSKLLLMSLQRGEGAKS